MIVIISIWNDGDHLSWEAGGVSSWHCPWFPWYIEHSLRLLFLKTSTKKTSTSIKRNTGRFADFHPYLYFCRRKFDVLTSDLCSWQPKSYPAMLLVCHDIRRRGRRGTFSTGCWAKQAKILSKPREDEEKSNWSITWAKVAKIQVEPSLHLQPRQL